MRKTVIRYLVCLAVALPVVGCERGSQAPDSDGAEATAAGAPATDVPTAVTPMGPGPATAVPTTGPAPLASPAAPGAGGSAAPGTGPGASTPLASNAGEVPRMPVGEAAALVQRGEALIVDVRDAESFRADRIQGAVNLPLGEVAARGAELPKDKVIVTYCA